MKTAHDTGPGPGLVSLVGAGPGHPDLLTVRATERLRTADLVLYDALVDPRVLALAPTAQRFSVGKRAGRRSVEQPTIDRLMIRAARRGKRVVRLKSGDPFVLGRGGEEALVLRDADIPFEVVPGVTSAVAAPALAGIPLTHRGITSGFLVTSGHADTVFAAGVDSLRPNSVTLVVLMGLARRARIAVRLVESGWRADTPAALVLDASGPEMCVWYGRLDQLGRADVGMTATRPDAPGTIVIGDVVDLHARLADRSTTDATAVDVMALGHG